MYKNYEAIFIIKPDDSNKIEGTIEKIKNIFLSEDCEVYSDNRIGIKKLAYEIKNYKEGYFYYAKFKTNCSDEDTTENISKKTNTIKEILKYIIIRLEDE